MPERGDLLLVPFPFTDLSASKRRPVLALTAPDRFGDFVALPVTSRPQIEHAVPITAARSGQRRSADGELDTHQPHCDAQCQSRRKDGWARFRTTIAAAVQQVCAYIGSSGS